MVGPREKRDRMKYAPALCSAIVVASAAKTHTEKSISNKHNNKTCSNIMPS